ncbi:uncharacterized protein LOC125455467 isoform X3 [Stegostoma tigrinum]|uniref:uncharacterized protein LOC125455467 isoform X3 n=1 Tax=Stegostoma tigrinum TaxID=3053191 RepID=UPI0028707411|nr:uncharacterized protein LOC125455467 isoform X3 [Stegostoma tigrinum]
MAGSHCYHKFSYLGYQDMKNSNSENCNYCHSRSIIIMKGSVKKELQAQIMLTYLSSLPLKESRFKIGDVHYSCPTLSSICNSSDTEAAHVQMQEDVENI